jgi:hypothetical protein
MIATIPAHVEGLRPLHPGECLIHPFLGGENEDEHTTQTKSGIFIPLNPGLYPSHARVLVTHAECREAVSGDVVLFPYMAYDWHDVVIDGRCTRVAIIHENKLYGRFAGWDD